MNKNIASDYNCMIPIEIEDGIFLCRSEVIQNKDILQKYGINAIVNCMKTNTNRYEDFVYKDLNLKGTNDEDISIYFKPMYQWIEDNKDKKILLHCDKAVSCSVSIIISYLMLKHKWTFEIAMKKIKIKREMASPIINYLGQLIELEFEIFDTFRLNI